MLNTQNYIYWLLLSCSLSFNSMAADENKNKDAIVIETQVMGSQEQPKVLYIMPWQGIKKPIEIKGSKRILVMPTFQPINPKEFKKQVSSYHQKSK